MKTTTKAPPPSAKEVDGFAELRRQYGCGPVEFTGSEGALYERHLIFDNVVKSAAAGARERYEAFARSVRDILSQRWVLTEETYARENPKRVYYLSMEFLIGRSLANNVANLLLGPLAVQAVKQKKLDWLALLETEPDAGLGNGGLGRLAACFLDSMATMQLPAMGYGLRYEYGMFRQTIVDGCQREQPDNWLRRADPWEVARPNEKVEIKLGCSFQMRGGSLQAVLGKTSTLIGLPFDRPVVGYGGKTVNTLRLWAAAAPDYFDFQEFSRGDFVGAVAETLTAESLTRVLYPDDSTSQGQGLRFVQEYFLVACSLADLVRRFRAGNSDWNTMPEKVAIQLNDTHPTMAVPELMRILLDEAHLGWDEAWSITGRTLAYTNHTLLPEALEKWPVAWFEMLLPRHLEIIYRDQPPASRWGPSPFSRRRRPHPAREPDRGRAEQARPHGEPGHRRLPQHERRGRDPLQAVAHRDGQRLGRNVSRPLQQQDERCHAEALATAGEPGAGQARSPRPSAMAGLRTSRN